MVAKSKKIEGSVGFFHGGIIKQGMVVLGFTENKDPTDSIYSENIKFYGKDVKFKYVNCENAKDVFEKFKSEVKIHHHNELIYMCSIAGCEEILKNVSGIKIAHNCKLKEDSGDKSEPENDVKSKTSKKDTKKTTSKKLAKEEESESESDKEPEYVPKKNAKKSTSKKPVKEDESDSESDKEPEDVPKKTAKKSTSKKTAKEEEFNSEEEQDAVKEEPKKETKKKEQKKNK